MPRHAPPALLSVRTPNPPADNSLVRTSTILCVRYIDLNSSITTAFIAAKTNPKLLLAFVRASYLLYLEAALSFRHSNALGHPQWTSA